MLSPSTLGIITPQGTPVDADDAQKQLAANTEEPASVTPLENAIAFIYSLVFHLTKTVSLTCNFFKCNVNYYHFQVDFKHEMKNL